MDRLMRIAALVVTCALGMTLGCDDGGGSGGEDADASTPPMAELSPCLQVCSVKLVECNQSNDLELAAEICAELFCEEERTDDEIECYRTSTCPERNFCGRDAPGTGL
jgi:hypothetical protein